jgi:hypothetical protein
MNRRDSVTFLILEVLAIVWAGLVFNIFESKLVAGLMAGAYFVGFGLYVLWRILRWPNRWQSFTLYPLLVHLFVISIPMMIMRFAQTQLAFEDVQIWGLPGPVFHRLSTTVFLVLMIATAIDLGRSWKITRSKRA